MQQAQDQFSEVTITITLFIDTLWDDQAGYVTSDQLLIATVIFHQTQSVPNRQI